MDKYKTVVIYSYDITSALQKLEEDVNRYLMNGWKLQGGVCIVKGNPCYACQAMVK